MSTPLVSVIVPHHLDENQPYLDLCLDALVGSLGVDLEIICVSDAYSIPRVPKSVRLYHSPDLNTATKKANWAVAHAIDPGSKYLLFVSDDVVVHKDAVAQLALGVGNYACICNPLSNSDNGTRFLSPDYPGPDKDLSEYVHCEPLSVQMMVPQDYVSFYCTMIPKLVWDMVGELDGRLDVRYNDLDYCVRARKVGVFPVINFSAWAFHFGSKTLGKTVTPDEFAQADAYFIEKYGVPGGAAS